MRDWVANVETTYYLLGSVLGPHPYPLMVREFQSVIGQEARAQILDAAGRLPDVVVACVGGGSNAMGLFDAFIDDARVRLVGVEAGGRGIAPGEHAARFAGGQPGVLHGTRSLRAAGRARQHPADAFGVGRPRLRRRSAPSTRGSRRAAGREYAWVGDDAALEGFEWLARTEGILPALESSHAVGVGAAIAPDRSRAARVVLVNLSGRGDKDVETVRQMLAARQAARETARERLARADDDTFDRLRRERPAGPRRPT